MSSLLSQWVRDRSIMVLASPASDETAGFETFCAPTERFPAAPGAARFPRLGPGAGTVATAAAATAAREGAGCWERRWRRVCRWPGARRADSAAPAGALETLVTRTVDDWLRVGRFRRFSPVDAGSAWLPAFWEVFVSALGHAMPSSPATASSTDAGADAVSLAILDRFAWLTTVAGGAGHGWGAKGSRRESGCVCASTVRATCSRNLSENAAQGARMLLPRDTSNVPNRRCSK